MGGCYPLPASHKISAAWCLTPILEPAPADTLTPSYRPPTMDGEFDTPLLNLGLYFTLVGLEVLL